MATPNPVLTLSDGTPILLRLFTPDDRAAVIEAFRRLSPDSRYYRFWSTQSAVQDSLIHRFLHSREGLNETWAAQDPANPNEPGYGGASFWRNIDDPSRAEISFTIADEAQHRGVGTILLAQLWLRAQSVGIGTFHGVVLADNYRALDWFRALGAKTIRESGQFSFTLPLNVVTLKETLAAGHLKARLIELQNVPDIMDVSK